MNDSLEAWARKWGIETAFWDVHGNRHEASPQAVEHIVAALAKLGEAAEFPPETGTPHQAHQGSGRREWIIVAQLYSLRSARNWGHGDFTDLAALIDIAADAGAAGVGLNPLHALFSERPAGASPYSPNSRLFLSPLYIDIEAAPEFPRGLMAEIGDEIARLRQCELVDYAGVTAIKLRALHETHRAFRVSSDPARRRDFETFQAERNPALMRFAAFETLRRRYGPSSQDWPEEWREPGDDMLRRLTASAPEEMEFHQFVQWIADRQLAACAERARQRGMTIGLYVDLAVGVDPAGADAWIARDAMLPGLSVGAPPDQFNPAGQDWGLTTYDAHSLVRHGFEPLREMLRAAMRHAGAIRIDHVMGLMRLYVIPRGGKPRDGAYLRYPFAALLRVVAEESRRQRCIVIGEDLGTVPEGFRDTMHAWGLWSYLVMLFEREANGGFKPPQHYPAHALATFGTHDLATFCGWMSGHDLTIKRASEIDPGETDDERERSRQALRHALGAEPGFADVAAFLAATPSRLIAVALEDVLDVRDQVNVPGKAMQDTNWRRRLPVAVEALADDQRLRAVAAAFAAAGRNAG